MQNIKNVIDTVVTQKGISIKSVIEMSGLSVNGFYAACRSNSFKAQDIEKIATGLGIPVSVFFNNSEGHKLDAGILKHARAKKSPKVIIQIELDHEQESQILKMVLGKEFIEFIK